jgi:hypothetical protein
MRVNYLAPIEGETFDANFQVVFQGEPDDLGDGDQVAIELDDLQALQLANALIGWVTSKKESVACWVEAERQAELAIPG